MFSSVCCERHLQLFFLCWQRGYGDVALLSIYAAKLIDELLLTLVVLSSLLVDVASIAFAHRIAKLESFELTSLRFDVQQKLALYVFISLL